MVFLHVQNIGGQSRCFSFRRDQRVVNRWRGDAYQHAQVIIDPKNGINTGTLQYKSVIRLNLILQRSSAIYTINLKHGSKR